MARPRMNAEDKKVRKLMTLSPETIQLLGEMTKKTGQSASDFVDKLVQAHT